MMKLHIEIARYHMDITRALIGCLPFPNEDRFCKEGSKRQTQ